MALELEACLVEHTNYAEWRKPVVVSDHVLQLLQKNTDSAKT